MSGMKRLKIIVTTAAIGIFLAGGLIGYYLAKWQDGDTLSCMLNKMETASQQFHFSWDKVK